MAIELEMDGKMLLVKGGATVGTPLKGRYTKIQGRNRILFESEKLSYYLCWDWDGEDLVNLRRELVKGDFPKPIENALYFEHTENVLTLVGGAMLETKSCDSMTVHKSKCGTVIEMVYGNKKVIFKADLNNNVVSNITAAVDGNALEQSEDGSVTIRQQDNLLICEGGDIFSKLPDRVHKVSDTELHFTYGNEVWAYTCDLIPNGFKNVRKFKL